MPSMSASPSDWLQEFFLQIVLKLLYHKGLHISSTMSRAASLRIGMAASFVRCEDPTPGRRRPKPTGWHCGPWPNGGGVPASDIRSPR